jgi:uncharacterized coiled-coil protein SlyX
MSADTDLEARLSSLESSTRFELDADEAMICKLLNRVDDLESQLDEIKSLLEKAL